MTHDEAKSRIVEECLNPKGFASRIRENQVDEEAFARLLEAVDEFGRVARSQNLIDRLTIACLFELPWEIENTVDHYSKRSPRLGAIVSRMADELRDEIHEFLWTGFEAYYEGAD